MLLDVLVSSGLLKEGRRNPIPRLMAQRPKCTMKDVARLAGVSVTTVSAVINQTLPVSEIRRKRVYAAMAALDYHPDAIARSLKTGRTRVIGIVVPDITNAFYPEVVRGIEDAAQRASYSVLLCDSSEDPLREQEHLKTLFSQRVDGILLGCCIDSTAYATLLRRGLPIVFVDRLPPLAIESSSICTDNEQAATMATRYLIGLRHTRIAMLAGHTGLTPHRDRMEGFRKAMQEANLPIRDEYLVTGQIQIPDGFEACRHLLRLPIPPTAIMVSNNKLLLGVLQAFEEEKIRIPEQVSVLGFDDYIWNRYFNPSVTAVAQQTFLMGQQGFELLHKMMGSEGEAPIDHHVRLSAELRIRASTASPANCATIAVPETGDEDLVRVQNA
jgi:LacI family transcriptional regulator